MEELRDREMMLVCNLIRCVRFWPGRQLQSHTCNTVKWRENKPERKERAFKELDAHKHEINVD